MLRKFLSSFICLLLLCSPVWAGVNFDGVGDSYTSDSTTFNNDVGTIHMVIKPNFNGDDTLSDARYFTDNLSGRHAFYKSPNATTPRIQMFNDGRAKNFSNSNFTSGEIVSLTIVYNKVGNIQRFFIDGIEQTATGTAGTWGSTTPTKTFIGTNYLGSEEFDGIMHSFVSWSSVLTDAEIKLLVDSNLKRIVYQIQPSSLIAFWEMGECADGSSCTGTDILKDYTGNGHDGTSVGNPTGAAEEVLTY